MNNSDFYDIIDKEIVDILKEYSDDEVVKKCKDENVKKSYGFLLWFLYNNLDKDVNSVKQFMIKC